MGSSVKIETEGYGSDYFKDMHVGKQIMEVLEKSYPLHPWFVNCSHEAGTATIQLMYEGNDQKMRVWKFGYLIHLKNIMDFESLKKKIVNAGGEVLERYNMARSAATEKDIMNFMRLGVDDNNMVK